VQPNQDEDDLELLALADATDRVADGINDAAIAARLRAIADEMRAMARHGGGSFGGPEMLEACFLPA
jgi:hypothetical protein